MNAIARALTTALLHFVWQGALAAVLLWMALFCLRRRSANVRYATASAALILMAALPVATACFVRTRPISVRAAAASWRGISAQATPHADWLVWLRSWTLPVWSCGVLLLSLRLVWGCRQVRDLRRRGEPAAASLVEMAATLARRMGVTRSVKVLISRLRDSPGMVGWIRPVILLPAATIAGLTPEQLEAVLAHEIAHIRRYDYLVNGVQLLIETLLFYHPAVWWTSARIRHERELCCDDLAVRSCGDALCYARALTRLERLRLTAPGFALSSTGGPLRYRIQRLLGMANQDCGPSKWPVVLAFGFGLVCLALTANWALAQAPAQPPVPPAASAAPPGVTVIRWSGPYPQAAWEKRLQGSVMLEVTLDESGSVADARVLTGAIELRRAALESVLKSRFTTRQVSVLFELPPEVPPAAPRTPAPSKKQVLPTSACGPEWRDQLERLRLEKLALEAQLLKLRQQLSFYQSMVDETSVKDERLRDLNRRILEAETRLAAFREVYNEDHPDVRMLMAELGLLRRQRDHLGMEEEGHNYRTAAVLQQIKGNVAATEEAILANEVRQRHLQTTCSMH